MVKLTPELINQSLQFINPCRERELNLRGYKIPLIENLGATLDQFDCIDLSDNDLRKLDGFPYLPRIKCILLNNNRILRVGDGIQEALPNLESLVLTGNNLQELADIEPLTQLTRLKNLCLLVNPVSTRPYYREYIVYKLPNLRLLDFKKIRQNDRKAAQEFFRSKTGKDLLKDILKKRNVAKVSNDNDGAAQSNIANSQDLQRIREIIKKANSLQEVENLTDILRSGKIPDNFNLDTANQMEGIEDFTNE